MDLVRSRIGYNKKDKVEIFYSAEYGSEIRASLTYRTLGGEFIRVRKFYNRAECLLEFATITGNKRLLRRVEVSKEYQAWLENY